MLKQTRVNEDDAMRGHPFTLVHSVPHAVFSPSIARKGSRFVAYDGLSRADTVTHRQDGKKGYATGSLDDEPMWERASLPTFVAGG